MTAACLAFIGELIIFKKNNSSSEVGPLKVTSLIPTVNRPTDFLQSPKPKP